MGRERRRLLLVAVAGVLAAACARPAAPAPYTPPGLRAETTDGATLYRQSCAWCHGAGGEGTERGPGLDGELDGEAYTHYMLASGRMPVSRPEERPRRRPPAFTEEQIAALTRYVAGLGGAGPSIPRPEPDRGDLRRGMEIYLANCAACHSATGSGGVLTEGAAAPSLLVEGVSPTVVAEAVLLGPGCVPGDLECGSVGSGLMPRFDLTSDEIDDLTAYVELLRNEANRGGWSLARLGPVAEGAAGWVIGLGLLVAAARWIGTRTGDDER